MGVAILKDCLRAKFLLSGSLKGRLLLPVFMASAMGLLGCAGASADPAAAADAPEAAEHVQANASAVPPMVEYQAPQVPPQARKAVQDAYEARRKKRWAELDQLIGPAAADPVLGIYPAWWSLMRRVSDRTSPVPTDEIRQFLAEHNDTILGERLRGDWILAATRAGDYRQAVAIDPGPSPWSRVKCARLMAQHMAERRARSAEFLDIYQPNSDCWDLLDQLVQDQVISRKQLNGLLRDTLESGKAAHADRIAAVLFDNAGMVQYAALMKDPRKWLGSRGEPRGVQDTELATLALSRLARSKDRAEAARYINQHWARWIPKDDMHWVWGQFGLIAALNVEADAASWYRQSGFVPMTDYNHAWEVRAELRESPVQWSRVAQAIRKMTSRQADEPVWRYWYGRALRAEGNEQAARQYFESIATDLSFYGQLANEELGRLPYMPPAPPALHPAWVAQARANPGLQRAVALFGLGWRPEAVAEWNYALRGMSDEQLRGAAELAREIQVYDRVVNTSLLTRDIIDFNQRFVAPFEEQVVAKSRLIDLDPAWVYGLIRQESRFMTDARSHAGASGLMQLMPATAKWVARKIGMKDFHISRINDFDTNTVLGTNYLSMVLRDLNGSAMLASAGYNAGPGRPKRWRSRLQGPVEGAIFAETIPFTETRLYVKNVMSNTVYYSTLFTGQPQSLKAWLGQVSPNPGTQTALP